VNFDEYIADCEAKRDALRFRLLLVAHSKLTPRVRNERLRTISAEAKALREQIEEAAKRNQKRP
jgi:hypothetical protein